MKPTSEDGQHTHMRQCPLGLKLSAIIDILLGRPSMQDGRWAWPRETLTSDRFRTGTAELTCTN